MSDVAGMQARGGKHGNAFNAWKCSDGGVHAARVTTQCNSKGQHVGVTILWGLDG
jgi:hypothetical protein